MSILDRYIIKMFLTSFFFTMMLITMVAVSINYFEWVDKFVNSNLTFYQIVTQYYIYFIPYINGLLWPLFVLLAVIFFTSRLAKNSEIISIFSAKISYSRFLRPYMIGAFAIASILWVMNNYIIPKGNVHKNEFEVKYIKSSLKSTLDYNIHFWISPTEKIYLRSFNMGVDTTGRVFRLETFKENQLVHVLKANSIKFMGQKNKWKLEGIEKRSFNDLSESLKIDPFQQIDTLLNFEPQDFTRYTNQMELMTTTELRSFLKYEQNKGIDTGTKYQIELYRRSADPFTIFILTLIGVSVASRKVRGGMGFHIAVGVILGSAFVILSKFSTTFSTNLNLSPLIGVWVPNIIFSFVAWFLVKTAQK